MEYLLDTNICIYIIKKRPAGGFHHWKSKTGFRESSRENPLSVSDFRSFPAMQWKLLNVRYLKAQNPAKHEEIYSQLELKLYKVAPAVFFNLEARVALSADVGDMYGNNLGLFLSPRKLEVAIASFQFLQLPRGTSSQPQSTSFRREKPKHTKSRFL